MFSRRTQRDFQANSLTRRLAAKLEAGQPLLDLTNANPTRAGLAYPSARYARSLLLGARQGYEPNALGLVCAREAVAQSWALRNVTIDPQHIVLTASTSEAYAFAFKVLADPGDEVLVPAPSYPLIEHLAKFEGLKARSYDLHYDGHWHLDFDSIARNLSPAVRAICVVSPNNPTGSFVKSDEFARLAAFGVPLISDEVFAEFPLEIEPQAVQSALNIAAPLVLAFDGLSKRAALPQLKLGWIGVAGEPAAVTSALTRLELVADMFLSANTPVQRALPHLLRAASPLSAALGARLRRNLQSLRSQLQPSAASALRVEGGWSAIVRLPDIVDDWAELLLEQDNLLVQPGWFYDLTNGSYVVLSLLTQPESFDSGIERLLQRLAQLTAY